MKTVSGFLFRDIYLCALDEIPPKQRLLMYEAICRYGIYEETPEFPPEEWGLKALFQCIQGQMDEDLA